MTIWTLCHSQEVPFWSLRSQLPGVCHEPQLDQHGIWPSITDRGLANPGVCFSGHRGICWIHKHPLVVYQEICNGNIIYIRPAKEGRDIEDTETAQMVMDLRCEIFISEVEQGLHWCTHPQPFWLGKANDSSDQCKWLRHSRHSQPVQRSQDSRTCQIQLLKLLRWQTELGHSQSEAIGRCGDYEVMASLPQGSKS